MNDLTNDHDLLIELRTEVKGLRADVKEFNTGTITRLVELEKFKLDISSWREKNATVLETTNDHEARLRAVEKSVTMIMTWGAGFVLVLGLVQFLVGKFL